MRVTSDHRYDFTVEPEVLWNTISTVDDYRDWWPWLRAFEAGGLVEGDVWTCVVQPPLPYSLRFAVAIDEVEAPRFVTATITGDVIGTAKLEIEPSETGCQARLVSSLAPGNRVLQAVARFAAPVVRFGHDWVLDTGARQFVARAVDVPD